MGVLTRGDGTQSGFYSIYDRDNDIDIISKTSTGVTGTSYTKVSGSFTAPTGCSLGRVFFYAPTAAGTVYYDDVSFTIQVSSGVPLTFGPDQIDFGGDLLSFGGILVHIEIQRPRQRIRPVATLSTLGRMGALPDSAASGTMRTIEL